MSAKRRRAKADRNRRAFPLTSALLDSDWITSGRIACSYGSHDGNPCGRCGAVYAMPASLADPDHRLTAVHYDRTTARYSWSCSCDWHGDPVWHTPEQAADAHGLHARGVIAGASSKRARS